MSTQALALRAASIPRLPSPPLRAPWQGSTSSTDVPTMCRPLTPPAPWPPPPPPLPLPCFRRSHVSPSLAPSLSGLPRWCLGPTVGVARYALRPPSHPPANLLRLQLHISRSGLLMCSVSDDSCIRVLVLFVSCLVAT